MSDLWNFLSDTFNGVRQLEFNIACKQGDLESVKHALINRREYISELNTEGYSGLHVAAKYGTVYYNVS